MALLCFCITGTAFANHAMNLCFDVATLATHNHMPSPYQQHNAHFDGVYPEYPQTQAIPQFRNSPICYQAVEAFDYHAWRSGLPEATQYSNLAATITPAPQSPIGWLPNYQQTQARQDDRLQNHLCWAMFILAIYNLCQFLAFHEARYLLLGAHTLALVLSLATSYPIFGWLHFPADTAPIIANASVYIATSTFCLFGCDILQTKTYLPAIHRLLTVLAFACLLLMPAAGISPKPLIIALIVTATATAFLASLIRSWQGDLTARYLFCIGLAIGLFGLPDLVAPEPIANITPIKQLALSSVLLTLLLSISQAERIRALRTRVQNLELAAVSKNNFLATMSHELRTPLNAIFGLSALLQLSKPTAKQHGYIKKLEETSRYLVQLIGNILDIKKIENKNLQLDNKPFTLKSLSSSVYDMFISQAEAKGLKLRCQGHEQITEVICADKTRLTQVLANLIGNAIKYTQFGEVSLVISKTDSIAPNRLLLQFEVIDTGIGIAPDKLKNIFTPFVQLEPNKATARQGMGLGLAISLNLVEMMGGTLEVESVPGKGSRFFFKLECGLYPKNPALLFENDGVKQALSLPGTRILFVDDYELNVYIWRKLITSIGGDVCVALDGQSCILQLQQSHFDIVLIDISMPGMDGFELAHWIRKHSWQQQIIVIALTAYATPDMAEKCKAAGINDVLTKPFTLRDLHQLIQQKLYTD